MNLHIEIDLSNNNDLKHAIALLALLTSNSTFEDSKVTPIEKAPSARAAAKKTDPEPITESDISNALEPDEPEDADEALMEKAVSKATNMIRAGSSDTVKDALVKAGVARVSRLKTTAQVQSFLDALT